MGRTAAKVTGGQFGFGFKAFSGERLPPDLIRRGGRFASDKTRQIRNPEDGSDSIGSEEP
jgi:hypothetical protein